MHCHHEKLVVVDGEVAFVGGIDLTSLGGDRLDASDHPTRGSLGWHDAAARMRGPGGRGRRRPLPAPLARGDGRAAAGRRAAAAAGRRRAAARPHRAGADLRRLPARRVLDPRELPARAPRRPSASSTSRTSSSGRPRSSPCSSDKLRSPPDDRFRLRRRCCPRSRTTAATTRAASSALLADADDGAGRFLACTLHQRGERAEAGLRPRQDRDRRRPLADARLGQPQRALALQRHRDEHRHLGRRARARARGCGSGASTSSATPPSSTATRRASSTSSGARSPRSSSRLLEAGAPLTHRLLGLPGVSRRDRGAARAAQRAARRRLTRSWIHQPANAMSASATPPKGRSRCRGRAE